MLNATLDKILPIRTYAEKWPQNRAYHRKEKNRKEGPARLEMIKMVDQLDYFESLTKIDGIKSYLEEFRPYVRKVNPESFNIRAKYKKLSNYYDGVRADAKEMIFDLITQELEAAEGE